MILLIGIFWYQLSCNNDNFRVCSKEIMDSQREYLAMQADKFDAIGRLDSLGNDPHLVAEYLGRLKKELRADSVAWKSGADVVMRDIKSLLDLHYRYIDRQHSSLTLWATVLTIVFLMFSFYAIFKIEATLQEAKNKMASLDKDVEEKLKQINEKGLGEVDKLQKVANDRIEDLNKDIEKKLKEIDESGKEEIRKLKEEAKVEMKKLIKESEKQRKKAQLFSDGLEALNKEEYDKAKDIYLEYIKRYGKEANVYNNLGYIYDKLKEYNKAIESYSNAIALDNSQAKYYNNRGVAYKKLKEYDKTIEDYQKAIDLNPKYVMAYENLGNMYKIIEDYSKALEAYTKALGLSPDNKEKIEKKIEEVKQKLKESGNGEMKA